MTRRQIPVAIALLAAWVAAWQAASDARQQPRPDLSGVWSNLPRGARQLRSQLLTGVEPPMTPWVQARYEAARPTYGPRAVPLAASNDPVYRCLPPGVPRIYFHPMPMEIVQLSDRVLMLFEHDSIVRRIWLGRREAQPSELIPTYMGRSTGRWDGDTLVVETDTFNGRTWIDRAGHPASDELRVEERIQRIDRSTLRIDVVVDDAVAYRAPLHDRFTYTLEPAWRVAEHVCQEFTTAERPEEAIQ